MAVQLPGEILKTMLIESGMTNKELAARTDVTEKHISTIINGGRKISPSFAYKLGFVFKSDSYWMQLQNNYDSFILALKEKNNIADEEINILQQLKDILCHFRELGYISETENTVALVLETRKLLKVSNLCNIPDISYNAAYKAQLSSNIKVNPYVLFAWQRACELSTQGINLPCSFDKEKLLNCLPEIKNTMFNNINTIQSRLRDIFSQCGVAFAIVKNFRGAPVQGFIKQNEHHILLCLTLRGKRADRFWFALFHEIGHLLNGDYNNRFVDFDEIDSLTEIKADRFARDTLIPVMEYKNFINNSKFDSYSDIVDFAKIIHVQPYIVIGRLQNDGLLDWNDYYDKITKYSWD